MQLEQVLFEHDAAEPLVLLAREPPHRVQIPIAKFTRPLPPRHRAELLAAELEQPVRQKPALHTRIARKRVSLRVGRETRKVVGDDRRQAASELALVHRRGGHRVHVEACRRRQRSQCP